MGDTWLQVLLSRHPRQPMNSDSRHPLKVHTGFLHAWTAGGFRCHALQSRSVAPAPHLHSTTATC